jgi:hypothetical protein
LSHRVWQSFPHLSNTQNKVCKELDTQIPHLRDYSVYFVIDYGAERWTMQSWVIQERDFNGNVKLSSRSRCSFYRYSLWRAQTGEHLFDGAAGDLAEALDSLRAYISYLSAEQRGLAAAE